MKILDAWSGVPMVVVGMLHLPALPGSPGYRGDLQGITAAMLRDAETLAAGGVHGLMIENFGDVPFYPGRVPAEVVAHMTAIAGEVKRKVKLPLGINVLRNDGLSALAVAHAVGAEYIRVNVLCGARVADQGVLQGIAHDLLRLRAGLGADKGERAVRILADVDVKHSAALAERPIEDEVDDTLERGMADALIVSGAGTGKPTDVEKVRRVKKAAGQAPVFVGSGVTARTVGELIGVVDGVIVGTSIKSGGRAENAVELKRVRELMKAIGNQ